MTRPDLLIRLARILLIIPLRWAIVPTVRSFVRRWPHLRIAASSAYYLGAAMSSRGERLVGTLASGSRISLRLDDYAHHHIYFFGTYEEPLTRLMQHIVGPGCVALDVGANVGYYSLLIRDLAGEACEVHAFEPNPELASLLEESVRLNRTNSVKVVRAACGSSNGVELLYLSPDRTNTGRSTFLSDTFPDARTLQVRVIRLEDYCRENNLRPQLVKIDVEGYEARVLAGMGDLLRRRIPEFLIVELRGGAAEPTARDVVHQLNTYGYSAHSGSSLSEQVEPANLTIPFGSTADFVFRRLK